MVAISYEPKSPLETEVALVRKGLRSSPDACKTWNIIGIDWFMRWKAYVNLDRDVPEPRSPEEVEALHPGRIDNTSLSYSETFPNELRRGLSEGRDFVVIPNDVALVLHKKYGLDGNPLQRKVINVGTAYSPVYQISYYPVRVEAYHVEAGRPVPEEPEPVDPQSSTSNLTVIANARRYQKHYCHKSKLVSDALKELQTKFMIMSGASVVRYWLYDPQGQEEDDNATKKPRLGRKLLWDVVCWDGPWRLLRDESFGPVQVGEIIGNYDSIKIMIESTKRSYSTFVSWPRDEIVRKWQTHLQTGDMMDVQDKTKHWYEAVVKEVHEGSVSVHFLAWDAEFDEIVPLGPRLAPLHSETPNRAAWHLGQQVEVKLEDKDGNGKGKWSDGTIRELQGDKVQVGYKVPKPVASAPAAAAHIVDDDLLKTKTAVEEVFEWHELYSEGICSMYVHLVKPKLPAYPNLPLNSNKTYGSTSTALTYKPYVPYSYDAPTLGTPPVNGAVGLQNLGNTCFMNSILQCLSHTTLLTAFFLADSHSPQLNRTNPLGHGGKLAEGFAKLIKDLWANKYLKVVPRDFKTIIGDFQPQFAGYDQQDAQEFMGFLLDGLHEDLNRILSKPYVSTLSSSRRPDEQVASEAWRRYLLRNDSFLVDHAFGLLRSHLTCTNASCGVQSVTFDPYSSLSLPIPVRTCKEVEVLVMLAPLRWVKIKVEVEAGDSMRELSGLVSKRLLELGEVAEGHEEAEKEKEAVDGFEMVISPTPVPTPPRDNNSMDEDEGYAMVPPAPAHSPASPSPIAAHAAAPCSGFTFSLTYPTRMTTAVKHYGGEDTESASAITQWAGLSSSGMQYDTLMAHPAPPKGCRDVEVLYGVMRGSSYSWDKERLEHTGLLQRIALPLGSTVEEVHALVDRRLVAPLRKWEEELQFSLRITGVYSSTNQHSLSSTSTALFPQLGDKEVLTVVLSIGTYALMDHLKPSSVIRDLTATPLASANDAPSSLSIYDCLDKFMEVEALAASEALHCPACKISPPLAPIKKMDIWSAPDILILHLKRFLYTPGLVFMTREKITVPVAFPVSGLDLSKYVIGAAAQEVLYDLYAVCHHMGGLGGGHYTASCKGEDGKWFYYNDSNVSEIRDLDFHDGTPYVLFYKRRGGSVRWGGLRPSAVPLPDEE